MTPIQRLLALLAAYLLLPLAVDAQTLQTPKPSSAKEKRLIEEGINFHDRGDYDSAIVRYKEALSINSTNADAMYELAFSSYTAGNVRQAQDYLERAYGYDFSNRMVVLDMLGTIYDETSQPDKAIRMYQEAMRLRPDFYLPYFNMGVTLLRMEKPDDAAGYLKQAIERNPWHPGSNYLLGRVYFGRHLRTPALLALTRVLILDPSGRYGDQTAAMVDQILAGRIGGIKQQDSATMITLNVDTSEGNFMASEMGVDMMVSLKGGIKSYDDHIEALRTHLTIISELDSVKATSTIAQDTGFAQRTYTHFIRALSQDNQLLTFCHAVSLKSSQKGAEAWIRKHPKEMEELMAWVKDYMDGKWIPK